MNSKNSYSNGLETEFLMSDVLGKKYHGYASAYQDPTYFRKEVRKVLKRLGKKVDALIASEKFKEACRLYIDWMYRDLKTARTEDQYRSLFIKALRLTSTLLGYHYQSGNKREEPYFITSIWAEQEGWNELSKYSNHKQSLYSVRRKLVAQLNKDGHTYAEIAEIMNTSGYRVAQIIAEVRDSK